MLTAGIIVMVASVVVGTLALTGAALTSSPARSAGRRARRGPLSARHKHDRRYHELFGPPEPAIRQPSPGSRGPASVERGAPASAGEGGDSPRWVVALAALSGAGVVLGLVMVMVPSVT